MTREKLTIRKGPDAWYLDAERHVATFGTRCIPMPWMPTAKVIFILADVARLNPDADVSLGAPINP